MNFSSPYLLWSLVAAGVLLAVGVLIAWRVGRRSTKGQMRRALKHLGATYLKDVLIPDGLGGEIQLDYVVRLPDKVLVIDLKDMHGVLFGAEQIEEWTQIVERRSYRFSNPLYDNRTRCHAVAELIKPIEVVGRVVFTDAGEFPRGRPPGVSTIGSLISDLAHPQMAAVVPNLEELWAELAHMARPAPPINV